MQAMTMIDMSANALDTIVPAKPAQAQDRQFERVLNERRKTEQPEAKAEPKEAKAEPKEAKAEPTQRRELDRTDQSEQAEAVAEQKQPVQEQVAADNSAAPTDVAEQSSMPAVKLQKTLVDLLQALAGVAQQEGAPAPQELLSQLVQQLEGSELQGEQVLAGVDLTALVERLQTLDAEGGEPQLEQLVGQLEEQLTLADGLLQGAELTAAMSPSAEPRLNRGEPVNNLAQARQVLQKAIDAVAGQQQKVAPLPEEAAGQQILLTDEVSEEIDPRFAELLKPREAKVLAGQQQSLRQQLQEASPLKPNRADAVAVDALNPEQSKLAEVVEPFAAAPKQGLENLVQQLQGQVQASTQVQQGAAKVMPQSTPMVQLPSGQQVAESQIFDQVVTRMSGSFNGESGRMVLRLQPAELGSLKLELMVEGDRVRANLQAQSLQVQEVLERNLPHLKNALAEQGLKIDQFQVDVNRDQSQQEQFEQMAKHQQRRQNAQQQQRWQQPWETEEQVVPLAHLMQNGGGGISLHV